MTGFGFAPVGKEESERGDDASVRLLARVLHHVHAELHDVAAAHLERLGSLAGLTESLVVDKRSVAAAGVLKKGFSGGHCTTRWTHLEIKLSVLVPQLRMVARQHFTVENGVVVADFCACDRPADFHRLVGLEEKIATLEVFRKIKISESSSFDGLTGNGCELGRHTSCAFANDEF